MAAPAAANAKHVAFILSPGDQSIRNHSPVSLYTPNEHAAARDSLIRARLLAQSRRLLQLLTLLSLHPQRVSIDKNARAHVFEFLPDLLIATKQVVIGMLSSVGYTLTLQFFFCPKSEVTVSMVATFVVFSAFSSDFRCQE